MSDVMLRTDATVYWFNIFEMVATVEDLMVMKRKYPPDARRQPQSYICSRPSDIPNERPRCGTAGKRPLLWWDSWLEGAWRRANL